MVIGLCKDGFVIPSEGAVKADGSNTLEKLVSARNLLAVIHRDSGHYTAEHGFVQSCEDAETVVLALRHKANV